MMNKGERQRIVDKFIELNPETKEDKFIYRLDRDCIEWICPEHGCGHPIWDSQDFYGHGCCGCCSKKKMIK